MDARLLPAVALVAVAVTGCNRGGQPHGPGTTPETRAAPPAQETPMPAAHEPPAATPSAAAVRIEETTVATIDGWKVTVGNIGKGVFKAADGGVREGVTALVGLYDTNKADQGETSVGPGSELRIAGKRWRVTAVQVGPGSENGFVAMEPVP